MSNPIIQVEGISKSYKISHELKASMGNVSIRDGINNIVRKPIELVTGHRMKKEKFWALNDVSFDIEQGEVVGIVGKNGSGKSTLLKIMSRITEPTKGEIRMNGRVASLLEVGTGFHPELTGRENVYFNGSILGMRKKEIDSKFDEIVAFSEVEKFLDTPVKFYSSGMYVRLAFAIAAHLDPDILIVDEVLAVGDAAFQKKCLGKMQDAASQGRTVLFVSHNMPTVKALCKRAVWLDKGVVKAIGPIQSVADKYERSGIVDNANLRERPRTAQVTGEAKFVEVIVKNTEAQSPLIDSTKQFFVTFKIDSKSNIERELNLHARISASGQPILSFNSEFTNNRFKLVKGINSFTCEINPTNLAGGTYSVDCSLIYSDGEASLHMDEVFDAKTFTVRDFEAPAKDTYITQNTAVIYAKHHWTKD